MNWNANQWYIIVRFVYFNTDDIVVTHDEGTLISLNILFFDTQLLGRFFTNLYSHVKINLYLIINNITT